MTLFKKIEMVISVSLIVSVLFSILSFAQTSENIRNEVLRLHVVANSDSAYDQKLKLIVRDALLSSGIEIFDGSVNIKNAKEKIEPQLEFLETVAEETIRQNRYNYSVDVTLEKEYFTTRTYNSVTLPAGKYLCLKVLIGEGIGKNWWCVMFPPMCLSAADEVDVLSDFLDKKEINLINKKPQFEPRFKIIELFEKAKQKLMK